jgi:hypothetical protein
MDMPNEYYNQGRRRGNQPGGMFYQTPMGMPTSMQSNPAMAMEMQNNYDVASGGYRPSPLPGNRPPMMPGQMPPGPSMPGMPIPKNPLQAPNFPDGGPGMEGYQGIPYEGNPGQAPPTRPELFPPTTGPTGGTRIPGGPLQESPLGGGMPGVRAGEGGQMSEGMSRPRTGGRRMPTGGGQVIDGGWDRGQRQGGGGSQRQGMLPPPPPSQRGNNQGGGGGMGAQRSYSSSYNPNTNRNRNTTNRYSTGGNMNANRLGSRAYGRRQGSASPSSSRYNPFFASGRYQPRSGRGSYDTGGLYSPGSGGYSPGGHYDRYPRSPGMPNVTNRNTYNNRTYNTNRNYDQRRTYNTQTFNQGDTSIQGPRIAKKMGRMQGYSPMMHGSQSRQIGGLRNLQRMLAAMRGGRR